MGLCDESSAGGLLRELPGDFVRRRQKKASISIHLKDKNGTDYEIETIIESLPAFESLKQSLWIYRNGERESLDVKKFPWNKIFVCGYGAGRQTQGSRGPCVGAGRHHRRAAAALLKCQQVLLWLFCKTDQIKNFQSVQ